MGFRWSGFRKVRRQVCKRIGRRLAELGLSGVEPYRAFLSANPGEWHHLDSLCRITISRFYRDRIVFDRLRDDVLLELARRAMENGRECVRCWSAGCASGEEPYTLQIMWQLRVAAEAGCPLPLRIVATDTDAHMLKRAQNAVFPVSALKDLPDELADLAFEEENGSRILKPALRREIEWAVQDIRHQAPEGPFDLVLCRNLAFTYFEESVQQNVLKRIYSVVGSTGYLIVGSHERPPPTTPGLFRAAGQCLFRKTPSDP
jgi:chemotaxis protein methyltransferase CheR